MDDQFYEDCEMKLFQDTLKYLCIRIFYKNNFALILISGERCFMITHFYESFFVTIFVGIIFVGFAKNAHDLFISRVERIGQPVGNIVNEQGEGFPLVF